MKYPNLFRSILLATTCLLSPASNAATVDGSPSLNLNTNTGLHVWRTSTGDWQVRLVSGTTNRQQFSGTFDATQAFTSVTRVAMESSDVARISPADILTTKMDVFQGGADGMLFNIPASAGICLRDTSGSQSNVYLGKNAVKATTPVDLTGTGACGASATPSLPPSLPSEPGLHVSKASTGNWEVRLIPGTTDKQFTGVFDATQSFNSFSPVSLETSDTASLSAPDILSTDLTVWPGGYDGVNFSLASTAGVCIRSTSGTQSSVFVNGSTTARTTPVDLTGSGACSSATPPPPPPPKTGRKFNSGHYISLLRKNSSQSTMASSIKPGVIGFKKRYTWRSLEPTLGNFDFSEIQSDLNFLAGQGMQLIVLIEDKTFVLEKPTPGYLQGDQYTRANRAGGYTAVRWNPYVVTRKKALIKAMGARFDAHPNFEGIATQETAPSFPGTVLDATGYTPEKYRDALINILTDASKSMPTSRIFWMMNFIPRHQSYIANIATAVAPFGVVMGGPDIMPDDYPLVTHTYPFYEQFNGKMPLFGQIEPICYAHPHKDTSYPTKYWTMPELFRYGRDQLHVQYIFWVRLPKSDYYNSYNWTHALPVIANNPVFNP